MITRLSPLPLPRLWDEDACREWLELEMTERIMALLADGGTAHVEDVQSDRETRSVKVRVAVWPKVQGEG